MNDKNNGFVDPLEALVNKHKKAMGEDLASSPVIPNDLEESSTLITRPPVQEVEVVGQSTTDEINYGDDDLANEIANEEAEREEERKRAWEEQQGESNSNLRMPPDVHDEKYHTEAIDYQTDKVAIVTTMVNKVIAKHHIVSGGIPVENNQRMRVMGELIDIYHKTGEVITPEFERLILDNWVDDEGVTASSIVEKQSNTSSNVPSSEEKAESPTINITVAKDSPPVTINVDESITAKMNETNEVNIYVKEVSEAELMKSTIIENSQQEGIINVYDSGINDVPITLPLSGYRCVMRPINWFDFIKLTAPTSNSPTDNELKKWSVIYDHMKNPSIGEFKDFDDFLHKTKYQDKEPLMWALLVATADEEEVLSLTCANPKCRESIKVAYRPREIIHLDETLIPKHYQDTHSVAPGDPALKLWESINTKRTRYKLPTTGIIVEINEPSAYEFVTKKLPLVQELYERYRPGEQMSNTKFDDPSMMEFDYLSANALFISAMTIVKDGKEFRYTNWEDIEKIITTALDSGDSGLLLKIIEKARANVSPVSFYITDITCPKCHNFEEKININDIGNTLLFQVSRRLASTTINLIEMD